MSRAGHGAGLPAAADATVWRCPPRGVLFVAVVLIAVAEVGGGSMVQFKLELARWVRATMQARPEVHGLVGVRGIDEQILDEALFTFDAGLRLFHLHAEGMGLVILAASMVVATAVQAPAARRALLVLITAGGAAYPFGYLLWSALIPYLGVERGKAVAEWTLLIPFGTASIVALWWLTALLAVRWARG